MHRLFIILCCLGCLLTGRAEVRWLETEHDFGAFREDMGPQTARYRFVNTGLEDVAVISARANCGCTQPVYSTKPVAPGDTAVISVAYNPAGRPGRFMKYIRVQLSDRAAPERLTIKGVVIGNLSSLGTSFPVEMGQLRLRRPALVMGNVKKQSTSTAAVEWYNAGQDTLRPRVAASEPWLNAAFAPSSLGPGEQGTLTVFLRADLCPVYGLLDAELQVWPDSSRQESYMLPLTAMINEDFSQLTPEQLRTAPVAELGSTLCTLEGDAGRLTLTNRGQAPLLVRRVYTADRSVEVHCAASELKPGESAAIEGKSTGAQTRPFAAKVVVITNDPVHPVQSVRVVAE